jgi:hypothetical protein
MGKVLFVAIIFAGALFVLPVPAHAKSKTLQFRTINACMESSAPMVYLAMPEASHIMAMAGFNLAWHGRKSCPAGAIQVALERDLSRQPMAEALGWANPSDGIHVGIAIRSIEAFGVVTGQHMLACAIAHEIGHLLEGTITHSPGGLMKATWTTWDLEAINNEQMLFDQPDVELMHDRAEAWSAKAFSGLF